MIKGKRAATLFIVSILGLLLASTFCIAIVEHAAASASWLGVRNPVFAWTLVGGIIGGYLGLLFGRFRTGRPLKIWWSGTGGILLLALLVFPSLRYGVAPASAPPPPAPSYLYEAWVTANALNIRNTPSEQGVVEGVLECGSRVRVFGQQSDSRASLTWTQVETADGSFSGYVADNYLERTSSGRLPDCDANRGRLSDEAQPSSSRSDSGSDSERVLNQPPKTDSRDSETGDAVPNSQEIPSTPEPEQEERSIPEPELAPSPAPELDSEEPPEAEAKAEPSEPQVQRLGILASSGTTSQFEVEVYDGAIKRTGNQTTIELQVEQTSTGFEGTWYPWGFVARNCVITDEHGQSYPVVPSESIGPEASNAGIGSSRRGRLVFRGSASVSSSELFTLEFAYDMNESIPITIETRTQ